MGAGYGPLMLGHGDPPTPPRPLFRKFPPSSRAAPSSWAQGTNPGVCGVSHTPTTAPHPAQGSRGSGGLSPTLCSTQLLWRSQESMGGRRNLSKHRSFPMSLKLSTRSAGFDRSKPPQPIVSATRTGREMCSHKEWILPVHQEEEVDQATGDLIKGQRS